ncbi:hypothetical protein N7532_008972 [Penicillium argentinense]|uniref:F-box domain-containing protein n=1 Tax=Penicillium argentinense TaxID=1131581 RepID=A0A9W9EYE9_9EURO|nr:uncharacterized protein N7532_008972 [Penicillium argentinense]KAJ5090288.1 hypothetical protein N7532_008972 [Penicillium argentinense]
MVQLLDLPDELLCMVSDYLDDECTISVLLQVSRRFYLVLSPTLYRFNVRVSFGDALAWAAAKGNETTARYALEAGASPTIPASNDRLPMATASLLGHEAVVRLLLDRGVDPNRPSQIKGQSQGPPGAVDHYESSPISMAASGGHENIVRLLLEHGAAPDVRCWVHEEPDQVSPLSLAVERGRLSIVKLLVSLGCDIHFLGPHGEGLLADAASNGHLEVVRFLLETSPLSDPPREGILALYEAARCGHSEIAELLLEHGVIPTPGVGAGRRGPLGPLVVAALRENYAVAEQLRKYMELNSFIVHGQPDDDAHRHLLLVSTACGWKELMGKLMAEGCSLKFPQDDDAHWGVHEKHPVRGASPERHWQDLTHLALAAHRGRHEIVELLLNFPQFPQDLLSENDPNSKSYPLLLATDGGHRQIVSTLLNHLCPHQRFDNMATIIYRATYAPDVLQVLLEHGTHHQLYAKDQEAIFANALRTGNLATVEMLKETFTFKNFSHERPRTKLFIEAAAIAGPQMVRYLLRSGLPVMAESDEVEKALVTILSRSDTESLRLLFDRKLVGRLVVNGCGRREDRRCLLAHVDSPGENWGAADATLDMLIEHRVRLDGGNRPPLCDLIKRESVMTAVLLLRRGADPLRDKDRIEGGNDETPLERAARHGNKQLVRAMLDTVEWQDVDLHRLFSVLHKAYGTANFNVQPLLRRFIWRKRYQHL